MRGLATLARTNWKVARVLGAPTGSLLAATLVIDDDLFADVQRPAAADGTTDTAVVEARAARSRSGGGCRAA